MATKYKLTWRPERGGRWRKRFSGKDYYFSSQGQGKVASYARCLSEWLEKKKLLEAEAANQADPSYTAWSILIEKATHQLSLFSAVDTPENRQWYSFWRAQRATYRLLRSREVSYVYGDHEEEGDPQLLLIGANHSTDYHEPPPWEDEPESVEDEDSVGVNADRFLRAKAVDVSPSRYSVLKLAVNEYAEMLGRLSHIETVSAKSLTKYYEHVRSKVDDENDKLGAPGAKERLANVKQFIRWCDREELITLPRNISSPELSFTPHRGQVEVYSDKEIKQVLRYANDNLKLYILLMLNCGMTQGDVADLLHTDVDWRDGCIVRKRSKTKRHSSVPKVRYKLWPETLALLSKYKSQHPDLLLVNANGGPLRTSQLSDGKLRHTDNIKSQYFRFLRDKTNPIEIRKSLKLFRKTSASKLGAHDTYSRFAQYFLGHAPSNVADAHYVKPSQEQFDCAIDWLRSQLTG